MNNEIPLIPFTMASAPSINIVSQLNNHGDSLFISYKVTGDLACLDLGATPIHRRTLKLWEKTCFELFIKNSKDQYLEFNFSPVFEWNTFYFEKKGAPLTQWSGITKIKIDILHSLEVFQLIAEIKKTDLPQNFFQEPIAGISSVIKEKTGALSYWAISHSDVRPNFHHFDSFKYKF